MAIRRISELDSISAVYPDDFIDASGNVKPEIMHNYLFETSEYAGEVEEANSYYLSKKLDFAMLSSVITNDLWKKINELSALILGIQNSSVSGDWAASVLIGWHDHGMPHKYPITDISCTNLTVQNDIHGCALSAKWL